MLRVFTFDSFSPHLETAFSPEFRNRLDAIVQFDSLPEEVILTIVDKFLAEVQAQLDEKQVTL